MAEEKNIKLGSEEAKAEYQQAAQRHHDYYVMAEKAGTLDELDKPQLEAALQRERDGLVKPLEEKTQPE